MRQRRTGKEGDSTNGIGIETEILRCGGGDGGGGGAFCCKAGQAGLKNRVGLLLGGQATSARPRRGTAPQRCVQLATPAQPAPGARQLTPAGSDSTAVTVLWCARPVTRAGMATRSRPRIGRAPGPVLLDTSAQLAPPTRRRLFALLGSTACLAHRSAHCVPRGDTVLPPR